MLRVKFQDILRATLPQTSGNEGWIGVSPRGDQYHVVVPVDTQIARGVMACNRPTDGTPFGGYAGWLYFRCPPFEDFQTDDTSARLSWAHTTADKLLRWLASYHIEASIESDQSLRSNHAENDMSSLQGGSGGSTAPKTIACSRCGRIWNGICAFLRDSETSLEGYRACLDDFSQGWYLFSHSCGNTIEVPVSRVARLRERGRTLIGTHACPGLCYYERPILPCAAKCEGAGYRRIAEKIAARRR